MVIMSNPHPEAPTGGRPRRMAARRDDSAFARARSRTQQALKRSSRAPARTGASSAGGPAHRLQGESVQAYRRRVRAGRECHKHLRRRTPSGSLALQKTRRQVSWLAGFKAARLPESESQWLHERPSPLTVAGAASDLRASHCSACAPNSLLGPCGRRREDDDAAAPAPCQASYKEIFMSLYECGTAGLRPRLFSR